MTSVAELETDLIPTPETTPPPTREQQVQALRDQGRTWEQIASTLGVSRGAAIGSLRNAKPAGPEMDEDTILRTYGPLMWEAFVAFGTDPSYATEMVQAANRIDSMVEARRRREVESRRR